MFIGTGTGSGIVGRGIRNSGGIVLRFGDNQFHVDPGVGAVAKAADYGVNLRENTALLLSHSHLHHTNDTNAVIDAMTLNGLDKKGVLIGNKTSIHGGEGYAAVVSPYHLGLLERFIAVDRNQKIGVNDVEIEAITARHSEPNSLGFKFRTPELTVTYTGDTVFSADIVEQYMGSQILILNVPNTKKQESNLCIEDAVKIIRHVNPRLAILTHFGIEMIKADPMYEVRDVQRLSRVQTVAARDGMIIDMNSFGTRQGQRTLAVR